MEQIHDKAAALESSSRDVLEQRALSLATEQADEQADDRISLLLFRIGEETYAVRLGEVREIFQEFAVTSVPCVPDFVLGVVNVRGEIISVTDSARLMGLGSIDMTVQPQPPAIVLQLDGRVTALVVDEIADIAEVPQASLEPAVSTIDRSQAEFVSGSAHLDDTMVGILHVDRVLRPIAAGRAS